MLAAVLGVTMACAAQDARPTLAIVHRAVKGVPAAVSARVETEVRAMLEVSGSLRVQGAADTALGMDEATRAGWKCDGGVVCMAALGRALAVSLLLHEEVAGAAATPIVRLRVIDVVRTVELGQADAALPEALAAWPRALRTLAEELPLFGGVLRVHIAQPIAELRVNGVVQEQKGVGLFVAGLPPGLHAVHVTGNDLSEAEEKIELRAGAVSGVWVATEHGEVRITAAPPPPPVVIVPPAVRSPIPRRAGLASAVTGLVLAALGTTALLGAAAAAATATLMLGGLPREPRSGRILVRDGQTRAQVTAILGAGVALAWTGMVLVGVAVALGVGSIALGSAGGALVGVDASRAEKP